ncbi:hypothetical protein Tco_0712458 [Tanacetum coccineum]
MGLGGGDRDNTGTGDDTGSGGDTGSDGDSIEGSGGEDLTGVVWSWIEILAVNKQGVVVVWPQTHQSRTALSPPQMGPDP